MDIMDTVAAHCHDVARHRHGCCVLQRCMDYAGPERKRDLVLRVSQHGLDLSQNAFGNYVVQVRSHCRTFRADSVRLSPLHVQCW